MKISFELAIDVYIFTFSHLSEIPAHSRLYIYPSIICFTRLLVVSF